MFLVISAGSHVSLFPVFRASVALVALAVSAEAVLLTLSGRGPALNIIKPRYVVPLVTEIAPPKVLFFGVLIFWLVSHFNP